MQEELQTFLSRLSGHPVAIDDELTLSSARKAQVAAWLRREGAVFDYADIDSPGATIRKILPAARAADAATAGQVGRSAGDGMAPAMTTPGATAVTGSPILSAIRVGIDIQSRDNFPQVADYRADAFYAKNYTAAEIAYCLQQAVPHDSLLGLWAAKEAVVKAGGGVRSPKGDYRGIEITHDDAGVPTYPGCSLSISHDAGLAVAVCIRVAP